MTFTRSRIVGALLLVALGTSTHAGLPAARVGDQQTCPMIRVVVPHVGGPITKGEPTVLIEGMPAARMGDPATCNGPPTSIVKGSNTVLIGGMPAARLGDPTSHGGKITTGAKTVLIGG